MQFETALGWWHLGVLTRRRYEFIRRHYGSLDDALAQIGPGLLRTIGLREDPIMDALQRWKEFDPEKVQEQMAAKNVQLLSIEDDHYPIRLREIADPPIFLSYIGSLDALRGPAISIVGTRRMSGYGKRIVEAFVPVFVQSGMVTISGLALGIDAHVAKETLKANGKTVAVLGNGLQTICPSSHTHLAEEIVQHGGLLLSEFPLERMPDLYTFPARNRIIAGLSLGTLVCEAPEDSGSIITAELALEYGREVFAVPGHMFDENFNGCHRLIATGQARLVCSAEEVLREIGMIPSGSAKSLLFIPRTSDEEAVFSVLNAMPQTMDELMERTALDVGRIGATLTLMELAGAARNIGAGQWVRA